MPDVFRIQESSLHPYWPRLEDQWAAGYRNGAELWRRLQARGCRGSPRVVGEWTTHRRRVEKTDVETLRRIPSARTITRLLTVGGIRSRKAETVTVAASESGVPTLVEARQIIAEFHLMIRRSAAADLSPWIERARASLVASFASGVTNDEAAVRAAITSPWSNRLTEGQITRLKLVRRQMYSREDQRRTRWQREIRARAFQSAASLTLPKRVPWRSSCCAIQPAMRSSGRRSQRASRSSFSTRRDLRILLA